MIMDYKEKYNKLVEAVKVLQEANPSDEGIQNWINDNVPELAESEDERIREALIRFHKSTIDIDGIKGEDIIAWLEKQGEQPRYSIGDVLCDKSCTTLNKDTQPNFEIIDIRDGMYICDKGSFPISQQDEYELVAKKIEQNPTDKVEPKFKVGDTIINRQCRWDGSYRIKEITDGKYIFDNGSYITTKEEDDWELVDKNKPKFKVGDWVVFANGNVERITSVGTHGYTFDDGDYLLHENCDKQAHLWSIADAKDGDVLVDEDNNIGIYEKKEGLCWHSYIYLGCDNRLYDFSIGGSHEQNNTKPATKEQCDALFTKMEEAGYEWDSDHKELKKIEMTDLVKDYVKQKSAWSEQGEERIKNIFSVLDAQVCWDGATGDKKNPYQKEIDWLKSLKQRLGGEKWN